MRTAPPSVCTAEPRPPAIAVPPTRTAAMASSVSVPPSVTVAAVLNEARKIPVSAMHGAEERPRR